MTAPNPFTAGTGKARLLAALRDGDVDAYAFAPVHGTRLAFDGMKPIGRLAPRVLELRAAGYDIPDVAGPEVGHSIYRLVSEPGQVSPARINSVATADAGRQSVDIFDNPQSKGGEATDGVPTTPIFSGSPESADAAVAAAGSADERAGVDRRLTTGQRTGPASPDGLHYPVAGASEGPPAPLIPNVAQAGIAASMHAQFDDDGDDDLGWIADRYDDTRRAA